MRNPFSTSRRTREGIVVNLVLIGICLFALLPIATTVLVSFKGERDVTRKPPIIFPCDTPTSKFDLSACRWSTEGYERVIALKPSETSPFGFAITGRLLRVYLPTCTVEETAFVFGPVERYLCEDSDPKQLLAFRHEDGLLRKQVTRIHA